jgi:hypothetical protein
MAGETLKITGGNASGQTITLEQELVIGRSTPGLGSLGGDTEISRVHARVFHDPSGRLMIEDLGSTNGTFVNGNRISGQQALNPGDQVRVGQTSLSVEGGVADPGATAIGQVIPEAPAAAAAAVPPPASAQPPPTQQLPPTGPLGGPPGGPPPGGPGFGGPGGPGGGAQGGGGTNRNLLIAIAAVVVLALVVAGLAIGGVFGGSDDKKSDTTAQTTPTTSTTATTTPTNVMPSVPTTDTQTPPTSQGSFPPKIKQQFIAGCSKSGKLSQSQCGCIVNKAEKQYSLVEFLTALKATQAGNAPPKLVTIIRSCT